MAEQSSIAMAVNVLTSPREGFAALRERARWLFPLLLIISLYAIVLLYYYSSVDLAWMMDLTLPPAGEGMSEEQRAATIEAMGNFSPTAMGSIAAVQISLMLLVWFLLAATYLKLVGAARKHEYVYKQWFSLIVWCSLPLALTMLASAANLLASDVEFLRPDRVNPLSLATLLDINGLGGSIANRVLTTLDVAAIWAIGLLAVGYRQWTSSNWTAALLVAFGPPAIIVALLYVFAG